MTAEEIAHALQGRKAGDGYSAKCPAHPDRKPSLSVTDVDGKILVKCHAGCSQADVITALEQRGLWPERKQNFSNLRRPDGRVGLAPSESDVTNAAQTLTECDRAMLRETRCLSNEIIEEHQLGRRGDRIAIPVRDTLGNLENIRLWLPPALRNEESPKMTSWHRGCGKIRLFHALFQPCDEIVIVEGELDALACKSHGISAVTITGGATSWSTTHVKELSYRQANILFDNDKAGLQGGTKVAQMLFEHGCSVRVPEWPAGRPEKHDVTDELKNYGVDSLKEILESAKVYRGSGFRLKLRGTIVDGVEKFPFDLLPKPVATFLEIGRTVTECPDEFLCAAGLYVGSVIGGQVARVDNLSLANYFLIVGETGSSKKTTAQSMAVKILDAVMDYVPNRVEYLPPSSSNDDLPIEGPLSAFPIVTHFSIEGLQKHAIGEGVSTAVLIGEYGTLFNINKRQGQQNTIGELTAMYDGIPIHVRMVDRKVSIKNYRISILATSTESWLFDFFAERNIQGGYTNRHSIFVGTPSRIIPNPTPIEEHPSWEALIYSFHELLPDVKPLRVRESKVDRIVWKFNPITITWNPLARDVFDSYYRKQTVEHRQMPATLSELSARELTHAKKFAGLRSFLEKRTEISADDVMFGVKVARWSTRNLVDLVQSDEGKLGRIEKKVLVYIKNFAPIGKRDIAQHFGGKQGPINDALEELTHNKFIQLSDAGYLVSPPNTNTELIQNYFGESGICKIVENKMLDVGTELTTPSEQAPHSEPTYEDRERSALRDQ